MTFIEIVGRQLFRVFGVVLPVVLALAAGPLQAQTPVAVDTLDDGGLQFIYPEDEGGLTVEEKIQRLNQSP